MSERVGADRTLDDYARDWESNARADACFAILSDPAANDGAWDTERFLATGEAEIAAVMAELGRRGITVSARTRALDFGCGIGRLTLALGRRFDHAVGVDVSATMIERAQALAGDRTSYVVNQRDDLRRFDDGAFDFIYSNIVLQHVSNELQRAYLGEFCRVLAPGGVAVFQVPSMRRGLRGYVRRRLPPTVVPLVRRLLRPPSSLRRDDYVIRMEMNCLPERDVRAEVTGAGCFVESVMFTNAAEPDFAGNVVFSTARDAFDRAAGGGYVSPLYAVRKP